MSLTLSDLLEITGALALLVAAGLWDVRALLALVGALLIVTGYLVAPAPDPEIGPGE